MAPDTSLLPEKRGLLQLSCADTSAEEPTACVVPPCGRISQLYDNFKTTTAGEKKGACANRGPARAPGRGSTSFLLQTNELFLLEVIEMRLSLLWQHLPESLLPTSKKVVSLQILPLFFKPLLMGASLGSLDVCLGGGVFNAAGIVARFPAPLTPTTWRQSRKQPSFSFHRAAASQRAIPVVPFLPPSMRKTMGTWWE